MCHKYHGFSKAKRACLQSLQRGFEVLVMGETETVDEYFARTFIISNRVTSHIDKLEQLVGVEKIMRLMSIKFNYVVSSIEESNIVTTLSIDEHKISFFVHEQRMKG